MADLSTDDGSAFIEKIQRARDSWDVSSFLRDVLDEANPIFIDDVKVGEDVGTPAVIPDTHPTIQQMLAEPLTFQQGSASTLGVKPKKLHTARNSNIKLLTVLEECKLLDVN